MLDGVHLFVVAIQKSLNIAAVINSFSSDLADIFLMLAVLTLAEQDSGLLSTEGGRSTPEKTIVQSDNVDLLHWHINSLTSFRRVY
jgi:hypothetical protein